MKNQNNKYRYERKFFISDTDINHIKYIIKIHPAMFSKIFYKRSVNNIYFDTSSYRHYFDNVDGNMNRYKFRIRWYGDCFKYIDEPKLEIKIKKGLLGKKIVCKIKPFQVKENYNFEDIATIINNSSLSDSIVSEMKLLRPVLLNRYEREYYLSSNAKYRVTIDNFQEFYRIGQLNNLLTNKTKNDMDTILELKYNQEYDNEANIITNKLPFRLTKSSKFVSGINLTSF